MDGSWKKETLKERFEAAVSEVLSRYGCQARIIIETDDGVELTDIHKKAYEGMIDTISDPVSWETMIHKKALKNNRDDISQFELVISETLREFLSYEDGPHYIRDISIIRTENIREKVEIREAAVDEKKLAKTLESTVKEAVGSEVSRLEKKTVGEFRKLEEKTGKEFRRLEEKTGRDVRRLEEKTGKEFKKLEEKAEEQTRIIEKGTEDQIKRLEKKNEAQAKKLEKRLDTVDNDLRDLRKQMLEALKEEFRSYEADQERLCFSVLEENKSRLFYRGEIVEEFTRIIKEAKEELVICSPWIHGWHRFTPEGARLRFGYERYSNLLTEAAKRGVRIHIAYGWNDSGPNSNNPENQTRQDKNTELKKYLTSLKEASGDLTISGGKYDTENERICLYEGDSHIKCVIADESYMLIGSCNLLSSDPAVPVDKKKAHAEIMISNSDPETIRQMKAYCLTTGKKLKRIQRVDEIGSFYTGY